MVHRESSTARWSLAALCCVGYAVLWVGWVQAWAWLGAVDASTLAVGHRIGSEHPVWVTFWDVWCTVFSPVAWRLLAAVVLVYALATRQFRTAVFLLLSVELSGVLTEVLKRLADRPRPLTAMVSAASTSFPSGHAVGTMVAVLALGALVVPRVGRAARPWLIAAGVVIVVSVGLGRVALNVHHLSDVVAGWAVGYAYFVVCLLVLRGGRVTAPDETPVAPDTGR
jgi:membrane-associated phospholipid phosphatase